MPLVVFTDGIAGAGVGAAVAQFADPVAAHDADGGSEPVVGVVEVGVAEAAEAGRECAVVGPRLEAVDAGGAFHVGAFHGGPSYSLAGTVGRSVRSSAASSSTRRAAII